MSTDSQVLFKHLSLAVLMGEGRLARRPYRRPWPVVDALLSSGEGELSSPSGAGVNSLLSSFTDMGWPTSTCCELMMRERESYC